MSPMVASYAGSSAFGFIPFFIGSLEPIATLVVGSGGSASVSFNNIPSKYQHLQLRFLVSGLQSGCADTNIAVRFNGDTATNYALHELRSDSTGTLTSGAAQSANIMRLGYWFEGNNSYSQNYGYAGVANILDYSQTNKNKTMKVFSGNDGNGYGNLRLISNMWKNTSAITSISIFHNGVSTTLPQYSTFSLYGVVG